MFHSAKKVSNEQIAKLCETGWSLVRSEGRKRRSGGQNISQLQRGWGVPRGAFVVSLKLTLEVA